MRLKSNTFLRHFFPLCESVLIAIVCTAMTFLFLNLCKAEGAVLFLLLWTGCTSLMLFAFFRLKNGPVLLRIIIRAITFLMVSAGLLLLLIQLGATQRSLAEAWLEHARKGAPFGFFSFFAAEMYAVLLILSVGFWANKKHLTAVCVFFAVNALCVGIITGRQLILTVAVILLVFPLLCQKKWKVFIFPATCAAVVTTVFASLSTYSNCSSPSLFSFDSSKIMVAIAPDFPLMVHIPGYGYNANAATPQHSITLSPRSIFSVQGTPFQTLYFATDQFVSWNGNYWERNHRGNADSPLEILHGKQRSYTSFQGMRQIHLQLLEDFYPLVPCTAETIAVQLPDNCSEVELGSGGVLLIKQGIQRESEITLYTDMYADRPDLQVISDSEKHALAFSRIPPKICELAHSLYGQAAGIQFDIATKKNIDSVDFSDLTIAHQYIQEVLAYLKNGFIYSLESPSAPTGRDPFEYFLFESKKGFCTWYAGAFSLLMQAAEIPCRITEGYRVTLDQTGRGIITGMKAHAWPEVFIDGRWRIFEPTPVYTTKNPFAYILQEDSRTITLFSDSATEKHDVGYSKPHYLVQFFPYVHYIVCVLAVASIAIVVFLMFFRRIPEKRLQHLARRAVKRYFRKGIDSPEKIGWIAWQNAVIQSAHTAKEEVEAQQSVAIAGQIIQLLYAEP